MSDEPTRTDPSETESTPDVSTLQAQIAKLEGERDKALREAMERKRKLGKYEGVDVDEYNRLKSEFGNLDSEDAKRLTDAIAAAKSEEDRKLLAEKGLEGFVEHQTSQRLEATRKAHEKALSEVAAKLEERSKHSDALQAQLNAMRLEGAVFTAWHDKLADSAKQDALAAARGSAKFTEDGEIVWSKNGEELFAEGGKPATAKDWLDAMVESRPHWLKPSISVRAPGSGEIPKDNPFKAKGTAALAAQFKLKEENPELANKLAREAG